MLVAKKNNWITAIYLSENISENLYEWGISRADVSTGELLTMEGKSISKLFDEIIKLDTSEIIVGSNEEKKLLENQNQQITYTAVSYTHLTLPTIYSV